MEAASGHLLFQADEIPFPLRRHNVLNDGHVGATATTFCFRRLLEAEDIELQDSEEEAEEVG